MPPRGMFDDMSRMCPFMGFYQAPRYSSALSFCDVIFCPQEAKILFIGVKSPVLQKLSQAGSEVINYPHSFNVKVIYLIPNEKFYLVGDFVLLSFRCIEFWC